ncbi:MAG: nucleoside triphosphate pyrophosphohydrolase [Pseudomonadota bacterium]|nr:nucleoside triphosphate pyrophosphohydrolase [Pseudomonadota bacterium]
MSASRTDELLAIMRRLRAPGGCSWDRAQTFSSIAPYTIEEAYEVLDAIDGGDMAHLCEELGDLLFQVVFQAQIASEAGDFDFDDVAAAISAKLIHRHPHVFSADVGSRSVSWEDLKALERGRGSSGSGALDGVPAALPALLRASKLSVRAARAGFDFAHAADTAEKVAEELAEVRAAAADRGAGGDEDAAAQAIFEEVGDLLFAAANLARKLDVDAEAALRAANQKFERRFRHMERLAASRGLTFEDLSLSAQEALWQEVKRVE